MDSAHGANQTSAQDLKTFIRLEQRGRKAETEAELAFILANETIALVEFQTAVIFSADGRIVGLSGVSTPDTRSTASVFLTQLAKALIATQQPGAAFAGQAAPASLQTDWSEYLAPHALWIPPSPLGWGYLATRERPFSGQDIEVMSHLMEAFQHARRALAGGRRFRRRLTPKAALVRIAGAAALLAFLMAPVRLSVLAPAEVVPVNPTIVRSPLDGVVQAVQTAPNQTVEAGAVLAQLETTSLVAKLEVAGKDLVAAEAEYRQTLQLALTEPRARAQLTAIQGRIETRSAEIVHLRELLEKSTIKSPRAGRAIVSEPAELIGRPVAIGEKLLSIADEKDVEIEAWVGLTDVIPFADGDNVALILNSEPLRSWRAHVRYMSYEPQVRADGTVGYRIRARLSDTEARPRLGMRGTARLEGRMVPLAYWLLRRPLGTLRQFIGI